MDDIKKNIEQEEEAMGDELAETHLDCIHVMQDTIKAINRLYKTWQRNDGADISRYMADLVRQAVEMHGRIMFTERSHHYPPGVLTSY